MQSFTGLIEVWRVRGRNAMRERGTGKRILNGISWTVAGNATASISSLVGSVFVAKMLGAKHFGEFGIIQSTLGFFALLAGPSLGLTATKYVAELKDRDPERAGRVLRLASLATYCVALAAAMIIVFGATFIADSLLRAPQIAVGLRLAALALLFLCINGFQVGVLTGFEAFREAAAANIARGVTTLPAMLLGASHLGYIGAVWALVIGWGAACILSNWHIRHVSRIHGVSLKAQGYQKEKRLLIDFSLPSWIAALAIAGANWVTTIIMTRQPNGLEQMGIFNVANQAYLVLMFLPMIVGQTSLPILTERIAAGDRATAIKTTKRLVILNEIATWPLVAILCLLSGHIMNHLGGSYAGRGLVLVITLVTVPMYADSRMASSVVTAFGKMWPICWASALYFVVFVGMELWLAPMGVLGLSIARLASYMVYSLCTICVAYHLMRSKAWNLTEREKS